MNNKKINESKDLNEFFDMVFQKFAWSFIQFFKFLFIFIFYVILVTLIYIITLGYFIYKGLIILLEKLKENNKRKRGSRK